jgi:predicted transglutaminase-like cysteine proteinase
VINRVTQICLAAAMVLGQFMVQAHAADFMHVGGRTSQPVGHYEFCQRLPAECMPQKHARAPLKLTGSLWALINRINDEVNDEILPISDEELWGVPELWSFPGNFGDCEDFVLEKRRRLIAAGVPASQLLITVVRQSNGEGHAVLTISTDRGDLVLDNINPEILPWASTGYEFLKRQSSAHAGIWTEILDGRRTLLVQNVASTHSD